MMFGYACDETEALMPMSIYYSHRMSERLSSVRRDGVLPWLRPDGKTQVTVEYRDGKPARIDAVVVCHSMRARLAVDIEEGIISEVIRSLPDLQHHLLRQSNRPIRCRWTDGDAGLTGRKIIVDTYGAWLPRWRCIQRQRP